ERGDVRVEPGSLGARRVALVRGGAERGGQFAYLRICLCARVLCERERLRKLGDLRVEIGERRILAGHRRRQHELADREQQQHEDHHEDEARQRIDEAWPDVETAPAARERVHCADAPPRLPSTAAAIVRESRRNSPRNSSLMRELPFGAAASVFSTFLSSSWVSAMPRIS